MKRLFALLLCLVMCVTLLPAAYAGDIEIVPVEEEDLITLVEPAVTPGGEKLASKPTITTQPTSKTAYVGTTVKFKVVAENAETYQWYWRKNADAKWARTTATGNKTATLTLEATTARNGYQYKCGVKNAAGTKYSSVVTLTVSEKPVITTQPANKTALLGDTVKFTVKASGADSYQWYYRKSGSNYWYKSSASSATSATLSISATTARNGFQFCCAVKNAKGTTWSKSVTLTVTSVGGKCGKNVTWMLSGGTLTISGTGPMYDYSYNEASPLFGRNEEIQRVVIKRGVTTVGDFSFCDTVSDHSCPNLTEVTLPDTIVSIGECAFNYCQSLTSITLPDSLVTIGSGAFQCTGLSTIHIPAKVEKVGHYSLNAFSLTKITVASDNQYYSSKNGVLFNKDKTTLLWYPAAKLGASYTIPSGVKIIAGGSFNTNCNLTSITLPDSLTEIRSFPDGITSIRIPENVSTIDPGVFGWVLETIAVDSSNKSFTAQNNVLFNKGKTALICYPAAKADTSYTIPSSVKVINEYAFRHCLALTSVTIGTGVETIESGAFAYCRSLTDVYYKGTKTQWDKIEIGEYNDQLLNATIHYNA